jgi:FkbM family methyltransferase
MGFQHNHQYLSSESVVVEIGGNKGVFAQKMVDLYHPGALHVIEPVTPMVKKLKVRFAQHPEVHIHQFALAKAAGEMRMAYRSETDAAAKVIPPGQPPERGWEGATVETVSLLTFNQAWTRMGLTTVDLMNINIEGVEFQLVDALLASGAQARIRNLQIQFHVHAGIEVANKTALRCGFHRVLRQTHELVYNFDWVWEQWVLR